ncbi:MAG: hypothetical protein FH756_13440 [Firmicutes bacterium]|nr:hypothetical protein [Bacillota bacterium]
MKLKFLIYGLLGWGLEVLWTGLGSGLRGDPRLQATTYLWMFPIYGLAIFLESLHDIVRFYPWYVRGVIWVIVIWVIEFSTGGLIRVLTGSSPWNYAGKTSWHLLGLIRFDMAPVWFVTGLFFERLHDYMDRFFTASN